MSALVSDGPETNASSPASRGRTGPGGCSGDRKTWERHLTERLRWGVFLPGITPEGPRGPVPTKRVLVSPLIGPVTTFYINRTVTPQKGVTRRVAAGDSVGQRTFTFV